VIDATSSGAFLFSIVLLVLPLATAEPIRPIADSFTSTSLSIAIHADAYFALRAAVAAAYARLVSLSNST